MYKCPDCDSTCLRVEIIQVAQLYQEEEQEARVEYEDHSPYWDNDSFMMCNNCDFTGRAREFDV